MNDFNHDEMNIWEACNINKEEFHKKLDIVNQLILNKRKEQGLVSFSEKVEIIENNFNKRELSFFAMQNFMGLDKLVRSFPFLTEIIKSTQTAKVDKTEKEVDTSYIR